VLARFYAEITRGVAKGSAHWAVVDGPHGSLGFQQVDDFRPPVWLQGEPPMQVHFQFLVDDLAATQAQALAAGAKPFDFQPNSEHCLVYADPVGHPCCLSTWKATVLAKTAPRQTDETAAADTLLV
jgi:hypothetical protein